MPLMVEGHTQMLHVHPRPMGYCLTSQGSGGRERENKKSLGGINRFVHCNQLDNFTVFCVLKVTTGQSFFQNYGQMKRKGNSTPPPLQFCVVSSFQICNSGEVTGFLLQRDYVKSKSCKTFTFAPVSACLQKPTKVLGKIKMDTVLSYFFFFVLLPWRHESAVGY